MSTYKRKKNPIIFDRAHEQDSMHKVRFVNTLNNKDTTNDVAEFNNGSTAGVSAIHVTKDVYKITKKIDK